MRLTREQKLLKLLAARDAAIERIDKKWAKSILLARKAVAAKGCAHPVEAQEDFEWEHDSGYGVQRRHKGLRCSICRARQLWGPSSAWTEERDFATD